jgi:uncharacterized protein YukE
MMSVLVLRISLPAFAYSVKEPAETAAPAKKDKAQRYLDSAERLSTEAAKLEKRISKLPGAQQDAARNLLGAKRALADLKKEAAMLWKQHLGELPEEFKPKLREAQSRHSALSREYYRIGREIKEARKASATDTNLIAPASVFGK